MIVLIIVFVFSGSLLFWVAGWLWFTDFAVPRRAIPPLQRVLVIFPHADDEAVTCGGFLHRLAQAGCAVTLLLLTKGERGTPDARRDDALKAIRVREAQAAAAILGIAQCIQQDFGDGTLCEKQPELAAFIAAMIERERPQLLITYDRAGFYGHADHIACSEVVTDLHLRRFHELSLWYATFPKRVLARVKLPAHMATHPQVHARQSLPTQRIYIGTSVFAKINAWYVYKSQRAALTKGIGKLLPIWFFLSMALFEYFAEVE
jgi:LmbE family N-acetylglucosaminyl deacetylase